MDLPLVVLIKDRLVMGDENEPETAYCSGHSKAQRASKRISCIVVSVKSTIVFFELLDKRLCSGKSPRYDKPSLKLR